jgi:hypothetical protein
MTEANKAINKPAPAEGKQRPAQSLAERLAGEKPFAWIQLQESAPVK